MPPPDGCSFEPSDDLSDAFRHPAGASFAEHPASRRRGPVCYRISCAQSLADAVSALAARRGCDPSDLAAAALLLAPDRVPDPGSGPAWFDLLLPAGYDVAKLRRALAGAVALADPDRQLVSRSEVDRMAAAAESLGHRNKALSKALERMSFQPLDGKLTEVRDAARLFGFVNEWCFDEDRVVRRFRELAPVYHPDTGIVACRERMAQLIEARNILVRHVRTVYGSGAWLGRRPSEPGA